MKKVLIAINKLSIGGAETVVCNQANFLDNKKFEVYVGFLYESSNDNTVVSKLEIPKDRVIHFDFHKRSPWSFRGWLSIYRFLKENKIDIVVTNLFDANLVVRLAAIWAGTPSIYAVEHSIYNEKKLWQKIADLFLSFFTKTVFGVSREVVDFVRRQELIVKRKLKVLPPVFDLNIKGTWDRVNLRRELGIPQDSIVCMTIGRFSPEKAQERIIEVALEVGKAGKNIYFLIVGYGFMEEDLRQKAFAAGVGSNLQIIADPKRAKEYLVSGDIFLLTSNREGLGIVILEAMMQGLVPVAADVGGVKSIITDGEDGFLVRAGDIKGYSQKIELLSSNTSLLKSMGVKAKSRADSYSGKIKELEEMFLEPKNR